MMTVSTAFWASSRAAAFSYARALMISGLWLTGVSVAADGTPDGSSQTVTGERFAVHGQATFVQQATNDFDAPYSGPNSLSPSSNRETADISLFLGARLWRGAEVWVEPEVDQGFGLDNTLGVAGFPSGEAYKVGANQPYFRVPRWYLRQT